MAEMLRSKAEIREVIEMLEQAHTYHQARLRRLFHLLILEVEGEVSPPRFKRCLKTSLKQFQKDRADASSPLEQTHRPLDRAKDGNA